MATIGLSKPYVARYNNFNGVVSYEGGARLAKAVEANIEIESSENNDLYADNGIAETDRSFAGGTMTITTDDLEQDASALILGVKLQKTSVNGEQVTEAVFDDGMAVPYMGFGCVIKKQKNNVVKWQAVILPKIMFSVPSTSATTQGESIEWQTPELSASITRDDTELHTWKREAVFSTEAQAERYIRSFLNIPELGALTVTSVAGTQPGNTILSVSPAKEYGNKYFYTVGDSIALPSVNEIVPDGWIEWDGTQEITAATGKRLALIEANAQRRALKAGTTTVLSKEAQPIGILTVTSSPGASIGTTAILVTPPATGGNTYKYKIAEAVGLPALDEILGSDWTEWDGSSDISATAGYQIVVAEVDSESRAKKAGVAALEIKEE